MRNVRMNSDPADKISLTDERIDKIIEKVTWIEEAKNLSKETGILLYKKRRRLNL